jgi:EmrB/QacA subfamily drug resistance transporter
VLGGIVGRMSEQAFISTATDLRSVSRPATSLVARLAAHHWAPLPVVLIAPFMVVLDFFIVNVAVPSMQSRLHAGSGTVEWVIAGYGLTFAIGLITGGRLGDRFGRRRMFSVGLLLFTIASVACGLAPSPSLLVAARIAQGLAAALLMPQALAILGVVYEGARRVQAFSIYGMALGLAAVSGQLIGGALIQADPAGLGWRTVFLINLPIGVLGLVLAPRLVPESRADGAPGLDLTGAGLVTLGLTAIVLPLIEGRAQGWPLWTWMSLAVAPFVLYGFARHQRRLGRSGGQPLLHPTLFRERAFTVGLIAQLAFFSSMASFFLVFALYLQQGRGLDALQAGLVFTIMASAYVVASARAPQLTARLGRKLPLTGAVVLAAGHGLLAATVLDIGTGHTVALLVPALLLIGAGMGLVLTPLTTTVLANLNPVNAGAASGALSTMQQVGNALGVAVTGVIFYGAIAHGVAHAFVLSLVELCAVSVAVAACSRFLPRPASS